MARKILFCLLISAVYLSTFPLFGFAKNEQTSEVKTNKRPFYIEAKGNALYINRSKNFSFGNTVDGMVALGFAGQNTGDIDFDMGRWGGGYDVVIGTTIDKPLNLEVGFKQFFVSLENNKHDLPNDPLASNPGSVVPFIDGNHGMFGQGFFISTRPSDISYHMKYDLMFFSLNANMVYDILPKTCVRISLFGGPVYSRFKQNYVVDITGGSFTALLAPRMTASSTREKLIDNLYGGRVGIKGRAQLLKKLSLSFIETADLYYRYSRFNGTQSFMDATTGDSFVTTVLESGSLKIRESRGGLVPRLISNVKLEYELYPNVILSCFYEFDIWWNLTYVKNPSVTVITHALSPVNTTLVQDGSARIGTENVFSHALGGTVVIKF